MRSTSFLLAGLVLLGASAARAQADPDSVHQRDDCRFWAQVLSTGHPAPHSQVAAMNILACPEAGSAMASALRNLTGESDTVVLEDFLSTIQGLRDGDLYAAATALAVDKGATPLARITALRVLLRQPGFLWEGGVRDFAMAPQGACGLAKLPTTTETRGAPLPADYLDAIQAIAAQIGADTTDVMEVRNAARCVGHYVHTRVKYYSDWPPALHW
ncbi:MAG TPA: hypothetical protein VFI39_03360 [Gemmatimonadales bacterium]|nr:hypothetical protein [Gemmatimonadales bacterium]